MKLLLTNIRELAQVREETILFLKGKEMGTLPVLENAFLSVENDVIKEYGPMAHCPVPDKNTEVIDCKGSIVLPAWCDSHSHLVYAGNRETEFVNRIKGLSYEEIAAKGGGILNSAKKLRETPEEVLYQESLPRLHEICTLGTGAIEIKSGYGLTTESELKMLRVIQRLKKHHPVTVKCTFLGAHAIPEKYNGSSSRYLDVVINEMLPLVAEENLADYVDIFCEKGYFSVKDTERLLEASAHYGLLPKIHVNQFTILGGVASAVKHSALTVDHLELINDDDLAALENSSTMPVALPGCSFFLGIPYTPARRLLERDIPLALASDLNPGSSPSGNMNLVVALACIKMKMTPEEAINAATINGAYAMGLHATHGSITKGKKANIIITKKIPGLAHIPYAFGSNPVEKMILNGKPV
ncbi:imidazolonepropionase [Ascidiimonas aurantiaca]|uniref:imidazolonepropionase n=1 Tax=Ascidiimonas aurantiaca TaxID=1685432 RepID=UPI0030ED2E19